MNVVYIILMAALAACLIALAILYSSAVKRAHELSAEKEVEKARAENLAAAIHDRQLESAAALHNKEMEIARSEAEISRLREKADHDKAELEKLQASFRMEFKNLANDILEEKSKQFKEVNKESLNQLLSPFKGSLDDFRKRVDEIHTSNTEQSGAMKKELRMLMELNRQITEETTNLTRALKGNSKIQGDWGEMILETILERSHLTPGQHYTKQTNIKDEQGNNLRPDFIINMPDGKRLVIDSKVSLTAYVAFTEARNEDERKKCMNEHLRSVRGHVTELGRVGYQQNVLGSPDFVVMFVPTEAAFLAAIQSDSELWNEAYDKKVLISSPTNLTAILMVVHDLWKRDEQSSNSIEIAEEGAKMYDKFVGFVETLEKIGKNIGSAQSSYEDAMKQLKSGSGNLVGRTEKLRKLGVKATKSMPASVLAASDEDEGEEAYYRGAERDPLLEITYPEESRKDFCE